MAGGFLSLVHFFLWTAKERNELPPMESIGKKRTIGGMTMDSYTSHGTNERARSASENYKNFRRRRHLFLLQTPDLRLQTPPPMTLPHPHCMGRFLFHPMLIPRISPCLESMAHRSISIKKEPLHPTGEVSFFALLKFDQFILGVAHFQFRHIVQLVQAVTSLDALHQVVIPFLGVDQVG